jgi:hypothetical protein
MTLKDITTDKTFFDIHSPTLVEDITAALPEITPLLTRDDINKLCQYVVLMYDFNSPMLREVRLFYERKARCAEIVELPTTKGRWAKDVEDILTGQNIEFNAFVASYISNLGLPHYMQLVAYLEIQRIKTIEVFSGKISDKSDQILDRVTTMIAEITRKLFVSGDVDEVSLARKALYQKAQIDKARIIPRPEDIVKILEADGVLPEDFNPYGEDYTVEKSTFLGDCSPEV